MDRNSPESPLVVNRKCQDIPWDCLFPLNWSTLENLSKRGKEESTLAEVISLLENRSPARD